MSKGDYFKHKKLMVEFNKAMQCGDIDKAKLINNELIKLQEA